MQPATARSTWPALILHSLSQAPPHAQRGYATFPSAAPDPPYALGLHNLKDNPGARKQARRCMQVL
jgi:hypothetical protein